MPALTPEQVDHVALLSRLELTPAEKQMLIRDLNTILHHFERLQELDTEGVPPTSHPIPMQNVFREDAVCPSLPREQVVAEAPAAQGGFFVVPRIVDV